MLTSIDGQDVETGLRRVAVEEEEERIEAGGGAEEPVNCCRTLILKDGIVSR